jgi:trans-aconitate methyltransferase
MPNERQYQLKTRIIATRNVRDYRATICELVRPEDQVLEVGCGWGNSTRLLAHRAAYVLGTDVSPTCVAEAQKRHPGIDFAVLDAFDLRALLGLVRPFDVVYLDLSGISGFRSTLDVIALLNNYGALLAPRATVIKSGAMVNLARRLEARP